MQMVKLTNSFYEEIYIKLITDIQIIDLKHIFNNLNAHSSSSFLWIKATYLQQIVLTHLPKKF